MEFHPCSNCLLQILTENFLIHEAYCSRHLVRCPHCPKIVKKTQIKLHQDKKHSKQNGLGFSQESLEVISQLKTHGEIPGKDDSSKLVSL